MNCMSTNRMNLDEMGKFLEITKLTKVTQEERENLNRPTTSQEIESLIKKLPAKKSLGSNDLADEFNHIFKGELTPILLKLFPKKLKWWEHFLTHSVSLALP